MKGTSLPIQCLSNRRNEGLGYNYFLGVMLIDCEHYMMINGDNVEPVHDIETILRRMGDADMIIPYWECLRRRGWVRYSISVTYTWLVNALSGNHIRYYNATVLHVRRNVLAFYNQFRTRGFGYQAELVCSLLANGATYEEMAIKGDICNTRKTTAFRWKNVAAVARTLLAIAKRRLMPSRTFRVEEDSFVLHDLR